MWICDSLWSRKAFISWGKSSRAIEEPAPHSFPFAVTLSNDPVTGCFFSFGHREKIA